MSAGPGRAGRVENYSIKRLEPLCGYDRLVAVTTASIASAAAGVRVNYGTNRRELEWHRRKDKPAWWRYWYTPGYRTFGSHGSTLVLHFGILPGVA